MAHFSEFGARAEAEFPDAGEPLLLSGSSDGLSRRRWLQLMGASLALAGVGGCRWKERKLLPFAKRPADRTPGTFQRFATAMELGGNAIGLVVTCVDGRPIKVEGNPQHPQSLGATHAFAQAAILELYDPDRSQNVWQRTGGEETVQTWDKFAQFAQSHFGPLRDSGGAGFHMLAEHSTSPTLLAMRKRFLGAFPKATWHQYDPVLSECIARPVRYQLDKARVIVCLDADLLGVHPAAVRHAHDFAKGREPIEGKMNRLYVVESCFSITGAAADHRLALRSSQIGHFAMLLRDEIAELQAASGEGRSQAAADRPKERLKETDRFIAAVAKDLVANQGRSVVALGASHPEDVQSLVDAINHDLGNLDKTIIHDRESRRRDGAADDADHNAGIRSLAAELNAGKVQTLLILGGNPAYSAPVDLGFAEALGKVKTAIHLGLYEDETARRCTWHLPRAHFLESWGDAISCDGTYSVVQPMIEPLHGGKSAVEVLAMVLGEQSPSGQGLVRQEFEQMVGVKDAKELEKRWRTTLHDGLLTDDRRASGSQAPAWEPTGDLPFPGRSNFNGFSDEHWSGGPLEIVFQPDAKLYDGRFANNGWLQEMPDPMTRLTWDNAAILSPATAAKLGVENETLVKLKYKGREVQMPACILPGQADGTVAVPLGYGRSAAGHVGGSLTDGVEPVGSSAYDLRTSDAMGFASGAELEPTGVKYPLATTQDHHTIDLVDLRQRAARLASLVREATLAQYQASPHFANAEDHPPPASLWKEPQFEGHRWAMAIDLSNCTGCGACVVACQAENNVPIVGKQRVLRGREMHWLRIDRYFVGQPAEPRVAFQPLPCQHCELAPCEQVCPVAATVHSKEGLNVMAYNRCIGTRYCANNCPYKVRRFNFFNYHKQFEDPANEILKLASNPQVTVRSRGVMEKCTYCVQRIQAAKIEAKIHDQTAIADGQIKTACQQACPTGAIVFGDQSDRQSAVARACRDDRSYQLLAELNTQPRTTYLARIRNSNPTLESSADEQQRPNG